MKIYERNSIDCNSLMFWRLSDMRCKTVFCFTEVYEWYHEVNKEKKQYLSKELEEVLIPRYLRDFEEIVQNKGSYFGGQVSTI